MPAQVKKLIAELKRAYPELNDEPMLDDILDASYADGGDMSADEEDTAMDMGEMESLDEDMAEPSESDEEVPPPPKRKGGPRM
jgi:hypothetical protein